jgi:hypothetical protein
MGRRPGENGRELLRLDWKMEQLGLQKSTGMKATAREERKLKSKNTWSKKAMKQKFLLCIDNEGYEASLEIRKLYEVIPDKEAERHNQIRVIDESGEDYLYPSRFFAPVRLSIQTKNRILEKAV